MAISQESFSIKKQISALRQELIKIGSDKGICHPETIECSQELDKLILKFQILMLDNNKEQTNQPLDS